MTFSAFNQTDGRMSNINVIKVASSSGFLWRYSFLPTARIRGKEGTREQLLCLRDQPCTKEK